MSNHNPSDHLIYVSYGSGQFYSHDIVTRLKDGIKQWGYRQRYVRRDRDGVVVQDKIMEPAAWLWAE